VIIPAPNLEWMLKKWKSEPLPWKMLTTEMFYILSKSVCGTFRVRHTLMKSPQNNSYKIFLPGTNKVRILRKAAGRITINYSQTKITLHRIMAEVVLQKDPIVFECSQGSENNAVEVRGYYSPDGESIIWIKLIFDTLRPEVLDSFSE
jgi:hypothetical protein